MSHNLKLHRAELHLEELDQSVKRWRESNPYRLSERVEAETGQHVLTLHITRQLPYDWPLLVGDILFNLRASLDHLAFALVDAHLGPPAATKEAVNRAFPILDKKPGPSDSEKAFGRFAPNVRAVIEARQPYNRGNLPANDSLLHSLNHLHNVDKHRHLHIVAGAVTGLIFDASQPGGVRVHYVSTGALHDGMEFARFTPSEPDSQLKPAFTVHECFAEAFVNRKVAFEYALRCILDDIRANTILPLSAFL